MQLLLGTVRKTIVSGWICHSCRGIKHSSSPSKGLRQIGPARTRFAPSPTGYLHLGSLRTALFNYLVAKATGGQFLLRIEDTDQVTSDITPENEFGLMSRKKRTVSDAEERLLQDLEWAGIEWDEGLKIGGPYGPYKQSERTALYREHTELLLENGRAYRCFCTRERLLSLGNYKSQLGVPPNYDRTCAYIHKDESDDRAAKGEAHVVRLKVPEKYPAFNDLVYGLVRPRSKITTKEQAQAAAALGSYEDPILMKSDGFPTYHLANVVDDHHMKITHVIRGSEWMSSTPKHLSMYEAFGWEPPEYAHVGLLVNRDRSKLSKRNGTLDISYFRDQGVFPEALTNFVALLGWSHNQGNDTMSMEDLIKNASMKYTRGDTVVSFEKLWFLQRKHAAHYASLPPQYPMNPRHSLTELAVKPMLKLLDQRASTERLLLYDAIPAGEARENYVRSVLKVDAQNYTTAREFIARNIYFFVRPPIRKLREKILPLKLHGVPSYIDHGVSIKAFAAFKDISAIVDSEWTVERIKTVTSFIVSRGVTSSKATPKSDEKVEPGVDARLQKAWSKVVHGYVRWAMFAGFQGPDGAETMRILGKEETIKRLANAEAVMTRSQEIEKRKEEEARNKDDAVPLVAGEEAMMGKEIGHDGQEIGKWVEQESEDDGWGDLMDDDFL